MVKAVYDVILFSLNFLWRVTFLIYPNTRYIVNKRSVYILMSIWEFSTDKVHCNCFGCKLLTERHVSEEIVKKEL